MLEAGELRRMVERHFRVYDGRDEQVRSDVLARMYFIIFPPAEFDTRFEGFRRDLRKADPELLAFVRHEGGEDILFVTDRPRESPKRTRLHLILFLLTLATTVTAGAIYWHGYADDSRDWEWSVLWSPTHLMWGFITFAFPLMLILGIHEWAHYIAARRHGLRATLPFFIPVPPILMPIGTLGAFISLKDPLPDRKALFDVGASGPIAGFLVALPVILLGAWLTGVVAEPIPDFGRPDFAADQAFVLEADEPGRAVLGISDARAGIVGFTVVATLDETASYTGKARIEMANGTILRDTFQAKLAPGESLRRTFEIPDGALAASITLTWDDGLIEFGDPLLVVLFEGAFDTESFLTHPTFFAGWVGLLVTGINLLPASQLDGGHVARAVFGERMKWVAYAAVGGLVYLALRFQSWMLMAVFILLMGIQHPPPLNDRTGLDLKRKVLAVVVLAVFALTFIPRPIVG